MNTEVTLKIMQEDLLAILPQHAEEINTYFKLLQELQTNNSLINIVNTKTECDDLTISNESLFQQIEDLKSQETKSDGDLNSNSDSSPDKIFKAKKRQLIGGRIR